MADGPRFSVVIPTRERANTLRHALRTCLDQSFDDYEVVVCDNASSPPTRAVVEEAGSPLVRYVRAPEPLAMSANWELAVGAARGEYVLVIGDDDGLLPHALGALDRLLRDTGARAVRWVQAYYTWPDIALPGQGNYLRVPLGRGVCERPGAEAVTAVARFRELYTALPMLYNAAVRRDVLDGLRARAGRVFPHPIPDVYSGFAVAHMVGSFVSTTVPMSVAGQSGASNGIAAAFHRGRSPIDREFHALNAKGGFAPEPSVPDLPTFPHVPVADAYLGARRLLFPSAPLELDRQELARGCVALTRCAAEDWPAVMAAVRGSLSDDAGLLDWFDRELADTPHLPLGPPQVWPPRLGFDGSDMHLDAAAFGVSDVAGAAALCERVLNYRRDGVTYSHEGDANTAARQRLVEMDVLLRRQAQALELQGAHIRNLTAHVENLNAAAAERARAARGGLLRRIARRLLSPRPA